MSALDDIEDQFGVRGALEAAVKNGFGSEWARRAGYSIRWWPRRDAPTAALVHVYDHTRDERPWLAGSIDAPGAPRLFLLVAPNRLEDVREQRLARTVELLSPIPHDAALSIVDIFEFFGLGSPLREQPSTLSTNLAQVWHAPRIERGVLIFFYFAAGQFRRVTIDLTTAHVDDRLLG
jgi:hypothetical protein